VKVGLSFTLDTTSREPSASARLYGFMLEVAEEADRLGLDHLWYSEHHRWDGGHLTQPLAFCAAVAARTKHIRIGTGVVIAPFRSAQHLAEEAALADLISGGRFELAVGAGYRLPEFELFGAAMGQRYDATDARVREVRSLLASGAVRPRPLQEPLPIWLGYQGPRGARRAGLLGEGLLSASPASWPHYRAGLLEAGHPESTARMAGAFEGWISEDPEADWPLVSRHAALKYDTFRRHMVEGTGRDDPRPVDLERLRSSPLGDPMRYFLMATPEEAAERIAARVAGLPVVEIHIEAPMTDMDEARVLDHVTTVATRLRPLLEAR